MKMLDDKRAYHMCIFAFCLSRKLKTVKFTGILKGMIDETRAENRTFKEHEDIKNTFIPDGFDKPQNQLTEEEAEKVNHRAIAARKFVKYLEKYADRLIHYKNYPIKIPGDNDPIHN